jgi:hypothetical protein
MKTTKKTSQNNNLKQQAEAIATETTGWECFVCCLGGRLGYPRIP